MLTIAQILPDKATQAVFTIQPEQTVLDAIRIMAEKNVGALIVAQNNHVIGMFSERDYTRKIALKDRSSSDTLVKDIMSEHVITVSPKYSVEACLQIMTEQHIRHLPVLDQERLVGLISIGDLVKATIQEQQTLIEQLKSYIAN